MKINKLFSLLVILALLLATMPVMTAGASGTVTVMASDVGVSWSTADTRVGGASSFVMGPGTAPSGLGSLQMTTTSGTAKAQFFNYDYIGKNLSDLDGLSYWAYRSSASTNSAGQTISLNLEVDNVGDGTGYTTLVFEPVYQPGGVGAMLVDTWQQWDAFNDGNAIWWSTKVIPGVPQAFSSYVTWDTIVSNNPNAKIKFGLGFNVGSGWAGQFSGAADELLVNFSGDATTYDFEPTLPDTDGPVTDNVFASPNPAAVNSAVTVTANVDDSSTGGSDIALAKYSLDGGAWTSMEATDGAFDAPSEDVMASFAAPAVPGLYNLCVHGTDAANNTGAPACVQLVVYDPSGGFVTGGGWITSPEGAMPPTTTTVTISGISGDTSVDPGAASAPYYLRYVGNPPPAGYDPVHKFQLASPAIFTPSPEDGPVTLAGTIDVDDQIVGDVAMIGLLDRDDLAAGNSSFQRGAYIYVFRNSATSWRIGVTDGNAGGEIVQTFVTVSATDLPDDGVLNVVFTVDGTADGTTCNAGSFTAPAGCMTLQINGGSVNAMLTDSYGDIVGSNSASPEFSNGAVPGWDDYVGSNVGYSLTVPSMISGSPEGRANFGFISKYKKGASTPDGSTQFSFQAGDLNFHSSSYEWLVVNQNDSNAQFKGEGTLNGMGTYKFMLWAGDHDAGDTFRIKIWEEVGATEVVVYDNGTDQVIGGGNIIVHSGKGK